MTWSIVARDATAAFGVAVASRFFAVGALCPHARERRRRARHAGARQSALRTRRRSTRWRTAAIPPDIVRTLTAADAGRDHRQLHLIDAAGRIAAHTGARVHRLVRAPRGQRLFGRRQHARRTARCSTTRPRRSTADGALPFADAPASWRWRPARPPAATSAASRPPRSSSARRRRYPALDLRVDDHAEPDRRIAAPVREEPRALPAVRRLPAAPRRSGRHHRPRASSKRAIERFHAARRAAGTG